ncbi:MAG: threonine-phosphate decarboxylase CobD [Candidatus Pristimantibacillus sp.]
MLERYGHGGDLRTAEENFGLPADQYIDYSSNMNPFGPPPSVKQTLLRYADEIGRYPDPAVRGLRSKLAKLHQIDEQSILIGNGAAELIDLVVRSIQPKVTGLTYPCFAEYGDAVHKTGGQISPIWLSADHAFELTEENMPFSSPNAAEFYMIGSPNNPTGQLVNPELIMKLVHSGATVVVDEAFIDFVPDEVNYTLIEEASVNNRLFVIRSMTKFYAIPGIRLGYIVGAKERIAELKRLQVPWSVNSLAQQIGESVLEAKEFARLTLDWLVEERPWLTDQLEKLGMTVNPSSANYVLVRLPDRQGLTAARLQHDMGLLGVLIRDASHFPGLDDRYCRFAIKHRADNARLLSALTDCLDNYEKSAQQSDV